MKKIGITTTVPVEILLAAEYQPADLNNLFIASPQYENYIDRAERDGFPQNTCAWIKGIYGVCMAQGIRRIVGVLEGDCSNSRALATVLAEKGIQVDEFSYPAGRNLTGLQRELDRLGSLFQVSPEAVEQARLALLPLRVLAQEIDRLTWQTHQATGFENHLYQVSMSDLNGEGLAYEKRLKEAIREIKARQPRIPFLRLAYLGVPPMTGDLYDFVEQHQARVLYNEVQREFAFPRVGQAFSLAHQYQDYTYPYDFAFRVAEIRRQIELREIDAVIHYTQAFCHRAIEDIVLRQRLSLPVLTLEGDRLNRLDARTKLRLEAFLDMVKELKEKKP